MTAPVRDRRLIRAVDLYCGGGGFTTGLLRAVFALGAEVDLLAINHWVIAIETQSQNHPGVRHLCQRVESVEPRQAVPGGHLDLMVCAPECTHFAGARGGKPMSDQSRACSWHILHWVEDLDIDCVILENVKEFPTWGPLHSCTCGADAAAEAAGEDLTKVKHQPGFQCYRPIERQKGRYFRNFVRNLRTFGYRVEWKVLNAADYGDATTRERFFLQARKDRRSITWPEPTHVSRDVQEAAQQGSLPGFSVRPREVWRPAREIIDWSVPGHSIYMTREEAKQRRLNIRRPLAANTLRRIYYGLQKFALVPFLVPQFTERGGQAPRVHSLESPVPTVTGHGAGALVQPAFFLQPPGSGEDSRSAAGCGFPNDAALLVDPFLVVLRNHAAAQSLEVPAPAVCAQGQHLGVCQAYVVGAGGPTGQGSAKSTELPLRTVLGENHLALCHPLVIGQQSGAVARPVTQPVPTIAGAGAIALIESHLVKYHGEHADGSNGLSRAYSAEEPLRTVDGSNRFALVRPYLAAMEHVGQNGRCYPADDRPVPTITAKGDLALVDPYYIPYYSNGQACSMDTPVRTITAHDRFALVHPQFRELVDGAVVGYLDILFRMLMVRELAGAMSFPPSYFFAGTQEEQVKQVGNAVGVEQAKALCLAALRQP